MADIHPVTAAEHGIADGDRMVIETVIGSLEIQARVTEDTMPGTINIPHGWAEANVNQLTPEQPGDPVSGAPRLKSLRCRIYAKVSARSRL